MTDEAQSATPPESPASIRAAFRQLHGARLQGFALLVTLGDTRRAGRAAGEALAAGEVRAVSLRHPERAAAWVRAQAMPALRGAARPGHTDVAQRRESLAALGVDAAAFDGLAALKFDERAALVASAVERFEALDIETILGTDPAATRRAVARARQRYLTAVTESRAESPAGARAAWLSDGQGELALRVGAIAQRALGAGSTVRDT